MKYSLPFRSSSGKRKYKDQKFGYGGKKSGMKWNTKDSYNDVSSFRAKVAHNRGNKGGKKGKGGKQNVRFTGPDATGCLHIPVKITCLMKTQLIFIQRSRHWLCYPQVIFCYVIYIELPLFRNAPGSLFVGR